MRIAPAWIAGVAAAVITACVPSPRHQCSTGEQCPGGLCLAGGCAHADPGCPSGARYEQELGGTCVAGEPIDATTDAAVAIRCVGGTLETCVGEACELALCTLGCLDAPVPHCGIFAPANVPEDLDAFAG